MKLMRSIETAAKALEALRPGESAKIIESTRAPFDVLNKLNEAISTAVEADTKKKNAQHVWPPETLKRFRESHGIDTPTPAAALKIPTPEKILGEYESLLLAGRTEAHQAFWEKHKDVLRPMINESLRAKPAPKRKAPRSLTHAEDLRAWNYYRQLADGGFAVEAATYYSQNAATILRGRGIFLAGDDGTDPDPDPVDPNDPIDDPDACGSCSGSGKVDCKACGGTGKTKK